MSAHCWKLISSFSFWYLQKLWRNGIKIISNDNLESDRRECLYWFFNFTSVRRRHLLQTGRILTWTSPLQVSWPPVFFPSSWHALTMRTSPCVKKPASLVADSKWLTAGVWRNSSIWPRLTQFGGSRRTPFKVRGKEEEEEKKKKKRKCDGTVRMKNEKKQNLWVGVWVFRRQSAERGRLGGRGAFLSGPDYLQLCPPSRPLWIRARVTRQLPKKTCCGAQSSEVVRASVLAPWRESARTWRKTAAFLFSPG